MTSLPQRHYRLEKIKKSIRIFLILSIFGVLSLGFFTQDSSIYANREIFRSNKVLGASTQVFDIDSDKSRGFAPKSVTIRDMNGSKSYLVYSDFAGDIVKEAGIKIGTSDEILPSNYTHIPNNGVIVIVKVESESFINLEKIPFSTRIIEDDEMDKGSRKLDQKGSNGLLEKTIRVIYKDKKAYRSEIIKTKVITPPTVEIIRIGTKPTTIHSCTYWNRVIEQVAPKEENKEKNAWMRYVMYCESGCNSGSNIDKYFQGSKAFYGLYQFTEYTFKAYGGTNMFDGFDQINVVSRMYDLEGNAGHHWPACNRAFERDYNR